MLRSTRAGLVRRAGEAAVRTCADLAKRGGGDGADGVAGALAYYCAGAAFEVAHDGDGALADISAAISAAVEGAPVLGAFPFGEQGPLINENSNVHANLMMSILVFSKPNED